MSWFSEFVHDPIEYIQDEPWKAAALIGAPLAAFAAPFAAPAIGGALGLGAAEGAVGAGLFGGAAEGAGLFGGAGEALSGLAGGASEGLSSLVGGAGDLFGGAGSAFGDALGFSAPEGLLGETAGLGNASNAIADAGASSFIDNPGAAFGEVGLGSDLDAMAYAPDFEGAVNANYSPSSSFGVGEAAPEGGMPGMPDSSYVSSAPAPEKPGMLSSFWDSTKSYAMSHPFQTAGAGIAGLGLASNLFQGQRVSPEMKAMAANAGQMNAQSMQMMKYLQTGELPPGLQAGINQATSAMKAKIIANHAKNGMPTNPSQNSALAQELNGVDMAAYSKLAETGIQLLNSGISMAGISNQLYGMLEKLNRDQAQQTGVAIANFAAALNGGGTIRRAA